MLVVPEVVDGAVGFIVERTEDTSGSLFRLCGGATCCGESEYGCAWDIETFIGEGGSNHALCDSVGESCDGFASAFWAYSGMADDGPWDVSLDSFTVGDRPDDDQVGIVWVAKSDVYDALITSGVFCDGDTLGGLPDAFRHLVFCCVFVFEEDRPSAFAFFVERESGFGDDFLELLWFVGRVENDFGLGELTGIDEKLP